MNIYSKNCYANLTSLEKGLLKSYLFYCLYKRVYRLYEAHCETYAKLRGACHQAKENDMDNLKVLQFVIQDIIATGEYTLEGIAMELRIPYDVVYEVTSGILTDPSWLTVTKLFGLHSRLRPNLYTTLIKQISV